MGSDTPNYHDHFFYDQRHDFYPNFLITLEHFYQFVFIIDLIYAQRDFNDLIANHYDFDIKFGFKYWGGS